MSNSIGLHSWGPDASFDTHIAISIFDMCRMADASNFWHKWHIWPPTIVMAMYGNMGVKRSVKTSVMKTNVIKHFLDMFNSFKMSKYWLSKLSFVFFLISFVWCTVQGLGKVDTHPQTILFAFSPSPYFYKLKIN